MKSKSVIAMDGATCVKTEDGSLAFKRRTFATCLIVVSLGLFLLLLLGVIVADLFSGQATSMSDLGGIIGACVFLAVVIFVLVRNLRMPSVYLNASSRTLEIGRGASARQILFSSIGHIALTSRVGHMDIPITDIQALLNNGEKVQFGSVSGATAEARANAIAQLIADITGAPIRQQRLCSQSDLSGGRFASNIFRVLYAHLTGLRRDLKE